MTVHPGVPAGIWAALLLTALATGSPLFFLLSVLTALTAILEGCAVWWVSATLHVSVEMSDRTVYRGDSASLALTLRHSGWIPVAPLALELCAPDGSDPREIFLRNQPGRVQTLRMPLEADHVGVFPSGVRACRVEGLLGIFGKTVTPEGALFTLTVLPRTFDTDPLPLAPGDPGSEIMARATEDLSAPSDIRAYQTGDAMKKIHWKLSLRKGELMVRKFEEPVLREVLILMDCARPAVPDQPPEEAGIRDALLETAASILSAEAATDHSVRLPLPGKRPVELDLRLGLPLAFEALARTDFSAADRFDRVLTLESRRLRKVGCAVIITARLTSAVAEVLIQMRRIGPALRLYLIAADPEDPALLPRIARLRHAGIEVKVITC